MELLFEIIIGIALFTIIIVPSVIKNPLGAISDYPPAIRKRCMELGLIENSKKRFTSKDYIRKGIALIVFVIIFAFVLNRINGANTFLKGFILSYIIWLSIDWYDALILDCIWFCHSKKIRISGTEDMKEYKDYAFHIKQSCIGMLLGLLMSVIIGLLVMLF